MEWIKHDKENNEIEGFALKPYRIQRKYSSPWKKPEHPLNLEIDSNPVNLESNTNTTTRPTSCTVPSGSP